MTNGQTIVFLQGSRDEHQNGIECTAATHGVEEQASVLTRFPELAMLM